MSSAASRRASISASVRAVAPIRSVPLWKTRTERILKGVTVEALQTDPKDGGKKRFKIREYSQKPAREHKFNLDDGQSTTVERWWKSAKNVTLKYPNLGCVQVTKVAWYPLELLNVLPGSKFAGKLSPDQVADILKFTTHKPQEKMTLIRQGLQQLGYTNSETARTWGFEMSPNMLEAEGRVLPPPQIKVGKNKTVNVANGVFDMRGNHFLKPASLDKPWCVRSRGEPERR